MILFIIACIILYVVHPCALNIGVTETHLIGAFTYQFAHASWLHLIVNVLSLFVMFNPIYNIYAVRFGGNSSRRLLIACYAGSVIAALFTAGATVTVGCSGMVFFLLGVLMMLRPTLNQLRSYIYVAIAIGISIFFGNSNVALHILSFVFGCLYIIIKIAYDDRRIKDC